MGEKYIFKQSDRQNKIRSTKKSYPENMTRQLKAYQIKSSTV